MANLTIGLSGSSVVNGSKTWTISDPDVQRWINYLVKVQTPGGGQGAGSEPTGPPPTPSQALAAWAQGVVNQIKNQVMSDEREIAKKQAADNVVVPPLDLT